MRQIDVSISTYAAIWAARKSGENSEDAILQRLLKVPQEASAKNAGNNGASTEKIGFRDPRFDIEVPQGFEIFRTYLGTDYRATAKDGKWTLAQTGTAYPSLNQLSRAIGAKVENAWNNWYFTGSDGKRHLVTELRKYK
jgi:hypothetical protein